MSFAARFVVLCILMSLTLITAAQRSAPVAQTPPMGWNSWDSYGLTITEAQFRANVDVLKAKLAPFGWRYAVIDEGWFFENPQDRDRPETLHYALDPYGRYVPVPARFPSAAPRQGPPVNAAISILSRPTKLAATIEETSFAALGRYVHAQGLKFGIHIVRGIPRASVERDLPIANSTFKASDAADTSDACPWDPTNWGVKDNAAGQAWYDSLLRQYAAWGVDLLKVDCIGDHPYKVDEIRMIRKAIAKSGRPMVLSLSPGPMNLGHGDEVITLANMWRISDDEWDLWKSDGNFPQGVKDQFARLAAWESYAKPGTWPDADMLALGELRPHPGYGDPRSSRLTPDEQQTLLTLWAMARSPLILGANLTLMDDKTLALLTHRDLIALDQTGSGEREVWHQGDIVIWRSHLPGGEEAVAVFNTGDEAVEVQRSFAEIDPTLGKRQWKARDVWKGRDVTGLDNRLPPHGCQLLVLR